MNSTEDKAASACVVCGNDYITPDSVCSVCGFEQRIFLSGIPEKELHRIEAARTRWEDSLALDARMRELEAKLEEEIRLKKIREEKEAREAQERAEAEERKTRERVEQERQETLEAEFWKQCQDSNTVDSLRSYLERYPKGRFIGDVQKTIHALDENKKRKEEDDSWATALRCNTEEGFHEFIRNYPGGKYAAQAQSNLSEIDRRKSDTLEEEKLWRDVHAHTRNKIIYLKKYLDRYPEGKYYVLAKESYDQLIERNKELILYSRRKKIEEDRRRRESEIKVKELGRSFSKVYYFMLSFIVSGILFWWINTYANFEKNDIRARVLKYGVIGDMSLLLISCILYYLVTSIILTRKTNIPYVITEKLDLQHWSFIFPSVSNGIIMLFFWFLVFEPSALADTYLGNIWSSMGIFSIGMLPLWIPAIGMPWIFILSYNLSKRGE